MNELRKCGCSPYSHPMLYVGIGLDGIMEGKCFVKCNCCGEQTEEYSNVGIAVKAWNGNALKKKK